MGETRVFTPSQQQADFFHAVEHGRTSVVLEAVAGAGKTETLARAVKMMTGYTTIMMFNKSAATEFRARLGRVGVGTVGMDGNVTLPKGVLVGTCHSIGLSAWRRFDPASADNVEENKTRIIIERMSLDPRRSPEEIVGLTTGETYIKRLVSIAKQSLAGIKFDAHDVNKWLSMAAYYSIDQDLTEDMDAVMMTELAQEAFELCGRACMSMGGQPGMIDYDDMIWAPIHYNCKFFQVDNVVGDEWQDTNPARQELAVRCMRRNGRMFACGDSRQAIYGFTGASSDALSITQRRFNAIRMPLTVTYRCPKSVVTYVHQWVSHIEAHDDAPDGIVRSALIDPAPRVAGDASRRPWYVSDPLSVSDVILCRYNKPLVQTAFALIKAGTPCKMEGRDIGRGLIALITRFKAKTLDTLEMKLASWRAKEIGKARAKRSEAMEQSINDRVDCILVFMEKCRVEGHTKVTCMIDKINALFDDNITGILTLASGHKSKGREWDRVFWLMVPDPKRELQLHEQVQEDNLKYVIGTRSKHELVIVPEGAA
jgi:DNA helicase-2/ATP-dependent DNA helicase PcrA